MVREGYQKSGFASVDEAVDPSSYISYLDKLNSYPQIVEYKRQILLLMGIREGDLVLDVGCGTGKDLREMLERHQDVGKLVGIDNSQRMIARAIAVTPHELFSSRKIVFMVRDAHRLNFPTSAFDVCRSDRTFQYLRSPEKALQEMVRATKPRGRIVISEPNWDELEFTGVDSEVVRQIRSVYQAIIPNSRIGRELRNMFIREGLQEVEEHPYSLAFSDFASLNALLWLDGTFQGGVGARVVTQEQTDFCLNALRAKSNLMGRLNLHIVKGIKGY